MSWAPWIGVFWINWMSFDSALSKSSWIVFEVNAIWWIPSPFFLINWAIGESSDIGAVNSIKIPFKENEAIETFWDSTISSWKLEILNSYLYKFLLVSKSETAIPMWLIDVNILRINLEVHYR